MDEAAPQAAAGRTAGGQPREDAETDPLRRAARAAGVAAYLVSVKGGDRETARRIAGEMRALGLPGPDGQPGGDVNRS
jgi:hypothetical protein